MNFIGAIPASKSLMNRALILKSYFPEIVIQGISDADDVVKMETAISQIGKAAKFDCGDAGTTLRFLALRLSREVGEFTLTGSSRLFERPQEELRKILEQLGVAVRFEKTQIHIQSKGWALRGDTLIVPSQRSSQFPSAVALNAWDLPFDLYASPENLAASESYFRMTVRFLEEQGMRFQFWDKDFRIAKNQKPNVQTLLVEPDMSSSFSIAAAAAVSGSAMLLHFPESSLQPDFAFVGILKTMGVPIEWTPKGLQIYKAQKLKGVQVHLKNTPDLFPVLAALCALADTPSQLLGAPQLIFKESNRLEKIKELLEKTGCFIKLLPDGLEIHPPSSGLKGGFTFDTDFDHRLAMACGTLMASGLEIEVENPDVVGKSFPKYWSYI